MTMPEMMRASIRTKKKKQREIVKLAGMTEKQLSRLLHGERRLTAAEFLKLCLIVELDPTDFLACDEMDGVRMRAAILAAEAEEGACE